MKKPWYIELYQPLIKYLELKIPLELVYFPSTGITSALTQMAEYAKQGDTSDTIFLIVDLRAAQFTNKDNENREEFFRIVRSHLEQWLHIDLVKGNNHNIYHTLENVFGEYLQNKKKILMVFHTSASVKLQNIPEYRDLLVFLDKLRNIHKGAVNILITSTYPQFKYGIPAPIPLISKTINHFEHGRLYRTFREDLLKGDSKFRKPSNDEVLQLIELSGGIGALAKGLVRDLTLQDLKLDKLATLEMDQAFFDTFINCKLAIERMRQQLTPAIMLVMVKIINGEALGKQDKEIFTYLQGTGILDESGQVRSRILVAYCKNYCTAAQLADESRLQDETGKNQPSKANIPEAKPLQAHKDQDKEVEEDLDTDNFLIINKNIRVHKSSGEIVLRNKVCDLYLSEKELQIFKLLFENCNQEIDRERIAITIWAKNTENSYSDWAIDKLVSRIREKLDDAKPYKLIKTVRKKGFMLMK